ncbi:MAG: anthranilate synthase component I family protein [Methanobacteriota archaeon]
MILKELRTALDPLTLFQSLYQSSDAAFLLQSATGPRRFCRFSFLGFGPAVRVRSDRGRVTVDGSDVETRGKPPASVLREVRDRYARADDGTTGIPFLGGLVGYTSYEYVNRLERLPAPKTESGFPELEYGLFLDGVVYLHEQGKVVYYSHGKDRSQEILQMFPLPEAPPRFGELRANLDEAQFGKLVEKAKYHIREGDIFQVVLARILSARFEGDLLPFYRGLLAVNPSPYMYFLKFDDREIIGTSPEMLVRVDGGAVDTYPIAGTRPLGDSPAERDALRAELLGDAKERAEHAMLVDLARNDVGRIAGYGTVEVPEYMKVEEYSHVQHIVSRVRGTLASGRDAFDAYDAIFPAGTVTGAPKVRAMEIIHDLEPSARGPYAGSVGYFSLSGNADAAITIRTVAASAGKLQVQAGAGIVADSEPSREFGETQAKARALVTVLERIRDGGRGTRTEVRGTRDEVRGTRDEGGKR